MKILDVLKESVRDERIKQHAASKELRDLYKRRDELTIKLNKSVEKDEDSKSLRAQLDDVKRKIKKAEGVSEAVNHMGEREYQTYGGWKAACKKAYPGCTFRGDKDIGAAVLNGKDVGEWDGAVGSVYNKTPLKEDAHNSEMLKQLEQALKNGKAKLKELESDLGSLKSAARSEKEHNAVEDFNREVEKTRRLVDRLEKRVEMRKRDMQKGK